MLESLFNKVAGLKPSGKISKNTFFEEHLQTTASERLFNVQSSSSLQGDFSKKVCNDFATPNTQLEFV